MLTLARHFHVHPIIVIAVAHLSYMTTLTGSMEVRRTFVKTGGHDCQGRGLNFGNEGGGSHLEHSLGNLLLVEHACLGRGGKAPYQLGLLQVPHRAFKHFLAVAATLASMSCKKGTTATVSSDKIVTICIVAVLHRAAIFSKRRSWGITMVTNCMIGQTCHHCIAGFLAGSCNGLDLVALKLDHGGQHGDEKSGRRNVLLSSDTQYKAPSRSVESTGLASFAKLFDQQGVDFELLKGNSDTWSSLHANSEAFD